MLWFQDYHNQETKSLIKDQVWWQKLEIKEQNRMHTVETSKKKSARFYWSKHAVQDQWIQGECNINQQIKNTRILIRKERVQVL